MKGTITMRPMNVPSKESWVTSTTPATPKPYTPKTMFGVFGEGADKTARKATVGVKRVLFGD
jgi:hypothetical protein